MKRKRNQPAITSPDTDEVTKVWAPPPELLAALRTDTYARMLGRTHRQGQASEDVVIEVEL